MDVISSPWRKYNTPRQTNTYSLHFVDGILCCDPEICNNFDNDICLRVNNQRQSFLIATWINLTSEIVTFICTTVTFQSSNINSLDVCVLFWPWCAHWNNGSIPDYAERTRARVVTIFAGQLHFRSTEDFCNDWLGSKFEVRNDSIVLREIKYNTGHQACDLTFSNTLLPFACKNLRIKLWIVYELTKK